MESESKMRAQVYRAAQASALIEPCDCGYGDNERGIHFMWLDGRVKVQCTGCGKEGRWADGLMGAVINWNKALEVEDGLQT